MKPPQLAIFNTTSIPEGVFAEFMQIVAAEKLDLQVESRDEDGPFAALEWLIPTAVIVYISKSYFDGFSKEMGNDHYALLKAGLKTLHGKLVGPQVPKVTVISTGGKVRGDQVYSLRYSILAEAAEGLRFKLLIQPQWEGPCCLLSIPTPRLSSRSIRSQRGRTMRRNKDLQPAAGAISRRRG